MTADHEKCYPVMLKYAELYAAEYHEKWIPTSENITQTVSLFRSPMPGFDGYTPVELIERLEEFFKVKEDWLVSCKHNYGVFLKHIHRWIPKKTTSAAANMRRAAAVDRCPDHPETVLQRGEICLRCFPLCDKCRQQHAREDDCEEFAERMNRVNVMMSTPRRRGGDPKQLSELL